MTRPQARQWAWLTHLALLLAIVLVIARAAMNEPLRDPFLASPGVDAPPRAAGPATSLVLNLLMCLPAMLVLTRRVIDDAYPLRWAWSFAPLGLLAGWALLSVTWSSGDRFATVIGASHLMAAAALLWAAAQLVRSWRDLRLIAAVGFGLLLIYLAQAVVYRTVEWPVLLETWQEQREEFFHERGWDPEGFHARQFESKIVRGEILAFAASTNTFAAMVVLLGIVSAGIIIQRIADRDEWGFAVAVAAALPVAVWGIFMSGTRAAYATPLLAALVLLAVRALRPVLARHAPAAFGAVAALVVIGMVGVVLFGLSQGHLLHESLTFRWHYWVGSFAMLQEHWLAGVGWNNFGQHYLSVRLPEAPEEIKDPHNFIVRFFVELGIVGGALMLAWMLRMWWEMTAAAAAAPEFRDEVAAKRESVVSMLAVVAVAAIALNAVAALDWTMPPADLAMELLKRLLFVCLLAIAMAVGVLRSSQRQELDPRPAPWLLYAMLAGLGMFLLHNLLDFAMFETGPMFVMALLFGAALGVRLPAAGDRLPRYVPGGALAAAVVIWLAAALFFAIPVAEAERLAHRADEDIRAGRLREAATQYREAHHTVPINADYAFRSARALMMAAAPPEQVRAMLAIAIASDPMALEYRLMRARFEQQLPDPDRQRMLADYARALELNPNDVPVRLEYAEALLDAGLRGDAVREYELALWYNALLHPMEPKRLPPARVEQIERRVRELRGLH